MAENNIPKIDEEIVEEQIQEEPTQIKSPNVSPITRDTQGNLSTWFTPLREETLKDKTIVQEPTVEAPVIEPTPESTVVTPEVTAEEPKEEVKIEEKAPTQVQAPKQPTSKVETAQDIKAKETSNEAQENELNEAKKIQTTTELQKMIENGATVEELVKFWNNNKKFLWEIQNVMRGAFKNQSNVKYFGKYSTMNNDDMYASYKEWLVVPWSEEYNLLPPEKKRSFDNFLKIKQSTNAVSKTDYSQSDNVLNTYELESAIPKMFNTNIRENYKNALNSPEILWITDKIAWKRAEIDKLDIEMEDLQDNLTKSFAWDLPWSIRAKVKQEYNAKVKEKRLLLAEHSAYVWQFQSLKSDAETELKISMYEDGIYRDNYTTQLNLYETRRKEKRADLAAIQLAEWKEAAAKLKRQQDLEDMAFLEKNKQIAIDKALINDITLADYKNQIAKWTKKWSWEDRYDGLYFLEENWKFTKVIDWWVTENKDWTRTYTSVWEDGTPIFQMYDIKWNAIWANTNFSKLNQKQADLLNTPAGSIIPTRLKTVSDTNINRGKECAEYVNDIFWTKMWNTYQSKLNVANETKGTLWSIAVWQPNPWNPSFSKFGHAWVIIWESEDGKSWHIKSSNFSWDWVISVDEVDKNLIDWYSSTWIFETPIEDKQYSTAQEQFLKTVDVTKWTNKEMKATISNLWLTEEDVFAYKSKNVPAKTTKQFETLLTRLNNLKWKDWKFESAEWFNEVVWFWLQKVFDVWEQNFIAGTDAANFAADLDTFLANITIDNLDKMSWVLTDKDLEILKWAGTALSSNLSEKQFIERITELEKVYKKALWQEVIDTKDVIYTDNMKWSPTFGKEYSNETLKSEMLRLIELNQENPNEGLTPEQVKLWLDKNNITLK